MSKVDYFVASSLTGTPLRVKGQSKIDSIRTSNERRVTTPIRTWHCSRMLRRDFNTLTAKIFLNFRTRSKRQLVRDMIYDMQLEAELVSRLVPAKAHGKSVHSTLEVRCVSNEAKELLDIILSVDRVLSVLIDEGDPNEAAETCREFFACFKKFKNTVFHSDGVNLRE